MLEKVSLKVKVSAISLTITVVSLLIMAIAIYFNAKDGLVSLVSEQLLDNTISVKEQILALHSMLKMSSKKNWK
jgi:hypothetical protein